MKQSLFAFCLLFLANLLLAQSPVLYIHFVSHNEPNDNLQAPLNYQKAKVNLLQMANLINGANLKWNLQTCDGLVLGALNEQTATGSNILKTLANSPYKDNIQIDPRPKNSGGRNIADLWYLMDSCGANPTTHLGGCIYSTTNPALQPIDWEQYRNPKIGNIYGNAWQCSIITGAGSYPPHTNDLNDFGVFKPDSPSHFYQHNPNQNLWCLGTGCAPVLDSLSDEQAIINLIQAQVDSIQSGLWPANKFYITRIMTNQREYGPLFFQKVQKVINALSPIPSTKLKWATIGECFSAFQDWESASGLDHSQWLCGQLSTETSEPGSPVKFEIYPNPAYDELTIRFTDPVLHQIQVYNLLGQLLMSKSIIETGIVNISDLNKGIYLIGMDNKQLQTIVKQ